jgi:hypothetical protein
MQQNPNPVAQVNPVVKAAQPKAGVVSVNGVSAATVKAAARMGVELVQQPSTAVATAARTSDIRDLNVHYDNLNLPDEYAASSRSAASSGWS